MDDLLTGCNSVEDTIRLRSNITELLGLGGFPTNNGTILAYIPKEERANGAILPLDETRTGKTLGLGWNPSSDTFQYSITISQEKITKRNILSEITKIYEIATAFI
jgi:hypothetical protein